MSTFHPDTTSAYNIAETDANQDTRISIGTVSGLGIDEFTLNMNFSMFPNPATDVVNFSVKDDYKLYNVSGRLVKQATNTQSIDISGLTSGLYLINNSNGISKKLFIK